MKRYSAYLVLAIVGLTCLSVPANADIPSYVFGVTSQNSLTDMSSGATSLFSFGDDDMASPVSNIGFNMIFDGVTYSQFSVSTNGLVALGNNPVYSYAYSDLSSGSPYPVIAPLWMDLVITDGCLYKVTGICPNRVLTIQWAGETWEDYTFWDGGSTHITVQARLYEGLNRVEFVYGDVADASGYAAENGNSATIGIAAAADDYSSIDPLNGTAGNSVPSTHYNLLDAGIEYGTGYTYTADKQSLLVVGDPTQGASVEGDGMTCDGSISLSASPLCLPTTYTPVAVTSRTGTSPWSVTFTINGADSSEFRFGNNAGSITFTSDPDGTNSFAPDIIFTPGTPGVRNATLHIQSGNRLDVTYPLSGTGVARFAYSGDLSQGGTVAMASGDPLLAGISVNRLACATYQPLTVTNTYTGDNPDMNVTYAITSDPLGQYQISLDNSVFGPSVSTTIANNGGFSTPYIRFCPTGVGVQTAMLTVTTDCNSRTYILSGFSAAPGGEFRISGLQQHVRDLGPNGRIQPGSELFYNDYRCVGEDASDLSVDVVSTGSMPLRITAVQAFALDTTIADGVSPFPLSYDMAGSPILSGDYQLNALPGSAPLSASIPLALPFEIAASPAQQTIHLTYVAQRPGKRYARFYIYTNAQNFSGTDQNGATVTGLLTFDLFGRGNGASPSGAPGIGGLRSVIFPDTRVGDSSLVWAKIYNAGLCQLNIDKKHFALFSGDIDPQPNEFAIVTPFSSTPDAGGNYLIAPGGTDSVQFRFKPSTMGSRRATVWLQTNDSAYDTQGNTERGAYYWDLYGAGSGKLLARTTPFPAGVINGPSSEQSSATVTLENTLNTTVTIMSVSISGANATDFSIDPSMPVGTLPALMTPGQQMKFGVLFTPASNSAPGQRVALLRVGLSDGDTVYSMLNGLAGTRTLSVSPGTLFDNVSVALGGLFRKTVMVTNTGTLQVVLSGTTITGPDAASFSIGQMPRTLLDAGQTEYVELTFQPVRIGVNSAQFEVTGNQVNGTQVVTLGGKAVRIRGIYDPSSLTSGSTGAGTGMEIKPGGITREPDIKFRR